MASVVNVNITGSDELSATLTRSEQAVQRFGQTVNTQSGAFQRYEQGAVKARAALGPLQSGISELTGAMRQQSPAAAAAVSAVDNLSVSMIAAAATTGTWAGAIRVMMGLLNPWTIAIVAAGAALAYFSAQSAAAKKAQDEQFTTLQKTVDQFNALNRATELAGARTDRERLELQIMQERRKIILETTDAGQRELLLNAQADKAAAVRMEFNRKAAEEQKKSLDQLRQGLDDQANALNEQLIRLDLGAEAADNFKIKQLLASEAVKKLGAEGVALVREMEWMMGGIRRADEEQKKLKDHIDVTNKALAAEEELAKVTAEAWGFYAKSIEDATKKQLDMIETERELGELSAERLQILGKGQQSEVMRFQTRIEYLQKIKALETDVNKLQVIDAQILNAQTALERMGNVTIDIGQHVSRTLDDLFTSLISGTLKAVDVGKAATATIGRIASDIFSQTIKDKLKFELNLFNNVKGLPNQLNQSILAGGGGEGILNTLLFGGRPEGVEGPLMEGGGFFSGIGGILSELFGRPEGTEGPLMEGGRFISGGGGGGLGGGGGGGGALGTVGSVGSALSGIKTIWGMLPTTLTTTLSAIGTTISTTVTTVLNTVMATLAKIPIWGWIGAAVVALAGGIYRIIANQQERPNAVFAADFGLSFDQLSGEFSPGNVGVSIGRKVGIKNSQAGQIATSLQQSVQVLAQQWVDILNIFPDTIKNQIAPAIDDVNAILNQQFQRLKFSPGGSRNIQEELADIAGGVGGQSRFFSAFRGILASGFGASLTQAGIPGVSTAGFANMPGAANREGFDYLIEQIKSVTTLVSQLARTNAGQFLTGAEIEGLSEIFNALFSTSDVQAFSDMAAKLEEMLQPVMDAIEQAMQQSAELFGRGIMAALEAVSESDAQVAFFASFNQGLKEAVFSGITSAVLASAQFSGLLAPLQQKIREAVESALDTGTFDRMEFQSAILPAIETILSRVEMLRPLIDELQRFGSNINQRLGLVEPEEVAEPIAEGLTESATLFGQSLITAMEAATQSQAMTDFTAAFNTGIKDAVFSGLVESFLATGVVDQMLAPIRAAITQAVTESQTTGAFAFPDVTQLVANASAAASTWQPLIEIMQQFAFGIRDMLGLVPPAEVAPVTPGPVNVTINLNGTGNVDQGSIPELARRLNFMLEPALAPRA